MIGAATTSKGLMAWGLLLLVLVVCLWRIWPNVNLAQTGMLSLLPEAELSVVERTLLDQISSSSANTLLWMLEADARAPTAEDVDALRHVLENSSLFASVGTDNTAAHQLTDALRPWRYHLLPPAVAAALQQEDTRAGRMIVDARLRQLFSPGGMAGATGINDDPFGFFQAWLSAWLPLNAQLERGALVTSQEGRMLPAVLKTSSFDLDTQIELAALMQRLKTDAEQQGLRLRAGGVPAFAAHNAVSARFEVSTVGTISILGIVILVLFAFRSLRALIYALLAIVSGIAAGAAVSLIVFGQIHMLTWIFGASLIGIAIDYALHVLSTSANNRDWQPADGVTHVFRPTALGLISSVLGFATLLFTPFPVLREIAVFAIAGLCMAWLTCIVMATPLLRGFTPTHQSAAMTVASTIAGARTRLVKYQWTLPLIVLICIPGVLRLEPNDHISALQTADSPIAIDDNLIRKQLPTPIESPFFSIAAPDITTLLRIESELVQRLRATDAGISVYALSNLLTSPAVQSTNLRRLNAALTPTGEADRLFKTIGYSPALAQAELGRWEEAGKKSLDAAELAKHLPPPWSLLWQGCEDGICRSVVLLGTIKNREALAALSAPGVRFIDQVQLLSTRFASIRVEAVQMLGLAVLLVGSALVYFFGLRGALRITLVPCIGLLVAFAWLGYSGALYSVFNVFALLLVFGLGIDYAVFEHTTTNTSSVATARTSLAILLSAMTTLLAFGLLSLSETTVIAAFGSTLTAGITTCWLLSPLARAPAAEPTA